MIILLIAFISAILSVSLDFLIYQEYAESPAVARIAMIAMTTISSIRVKPDCSLSFFERDIMFFIIFLYPKNQIGVYHVFRKWSGFMKLFSRHLRMTVMRIKQLAVGIFPVLQEQQ